MDERMKGGRRSTFEGSFSLNVDRTSNDEGVYLFMDIYPPLEHL